MEIIILPEEHAMVQLDSIEIRAMWKAFSRIYNDTDPKSFLYDFEMSTDQANQLVHKLSEALDMARRNIA